MAPRVGTGGLPIEAGYEDQQSRVKGHRVVVGGKDSPEALYERVFPDPTGRPQNGELYFTAYLLTVHGELPPPGSVLELPTKLDEIFEIGVHATPATIEEARKLVDGKGTFTSLSQIRGQAKEQKRGLEDRRAGGLAAPVSQRGAGAKAGAQRRHIPTSGVHAAVKRGPKAADAAKAKAEAQRELIKRDLVKRLGELPELESHEERLGGAVVDALIKQAIAGGAEKGGALLTGPSGIAPGRMLDPEMASQGLGLALDLVREVLGLTGCEIMPFDFLKKEVDEVRRLRPSFGDLDTLSAVLARYSDRVIFSMGKHSSAWRETAGRVYLDPDLTTELLREMAPAEIERAVYEAIIRKRPAVDDDEARAASTNFRVTLEYHVGARLTAAIHNHATDRLNKLIAGYRATLSGNGVEDLSAVLTSALPEDRGRVLAQIGLPSDLDPSAEGLRRELTDKLVDLEDTLGGMPDISKGGQAVLEHVPWAAASVAERYGIAFDAEGDLTRPEDQRNLFEAGLDRHTSFGRAWKLAFSLVGAVATGALGGAAELGTGSWFGDRLVGFSHEMVPSLVEYAAAELR